MSRHHLVHLAPLESLEHGGKPVSCVLVGGEILARDVAAADELVAVIACVWVIEGQGTGIQTDGPRACSLSHPIIN